MRGLIPVLALLSALGLAADLQAAPADGRVAPADGRVAYEIRRQGGDAIGSEIVTFRNDGALLHVDVVTESTAHVLFLDFHYSHHRQEIWKDGGLQQVVMDTDDDGAKHHLEAARAEGGLTLGIDGKKQALPADALPLTLWGQEITRHPLLFSVVDGETYHVRTQLVGDESLSLGGSVVPVRHYRMDGDVERDLWFDGDGLLVKTSFERKGYPVEIVRQ